MAIGELGVKAGQSNQPFEAEYFTGGLYGGLKLSKELFWHDGPILFLAQDQKERSYLVVMAGENDDGSTESFMVISLNPDQLAAVEAASDVQTINDLMRAFVRSCAPVRMITQEYNGATVAETVLSISEAESHIGMGYLEPGGWTVKLETKP